MSDANSPSPTFTAPEGLANSDIVFELAVSDGTNTSVETVTITVNADNDAPTAEAGPAQSVDELDVVTLSGAGSDVEGQELTYTWTQVSGPSVVLSDANSPSPTFTAPEGLANSDIVFELRGQRRHEHVGRHRHDHRQRGQRRAVCRGGAGAERGRARCRHVERCRLRCRGAGAHLHLDPGERPHRRAQRCQLRVADVHGARRPRELGHRLRTRGQRRHEHVGRHRHDHRQRRQRRADGRGPDLRRAWTSSMSSR
ncbi:MAG: hypothetical protein IPJ77_16590 [Planctomycetes bacterium]|nr:hypothetical protein [Planctomycetota bacterium]